MKTLANTVSKLAAPVVALALAGTSGAASATELDRLDIAAPGAMVSVCGGIGEHTNIGDKFFWQPGRSNCNAQKTTLPNTSVAQTAIYTEAPITVDTFASGQTVMGQTRLYAHSRARQDSGAFPVAEATGGWVDMLTLHPLNPAQIGQSASFSFVIDVGGTLAGQGVNDSFNSGAGFGIQPYLNDLAFAPGPASSYWVSGQGQMGFRYNQTVDQLVTFTTLVTLGTPFELGVFARASAGNASFGSVTAFSEATVDFMNTVTWAGISALTLNGNPVPYTLASASGIDWTQPYAPVPEPTTWALWAAGLLAVAVRRGRQASSAGSLV
jgi:hypothetical protein